MAIRAACEVLRGSGQPRSAIDHGPIRLLTQRLEVFESDWAEADLNAREQKGASVKARICSFQARVIVSTMLKIGRAHV